MSSHTSHNREWKDQYTLLCEQCGYVLEGLDQDGPCPECGKLIEESLPERRIGTPWQKNPGFKSLISTWIFTLNHPFQTLRILRVQSSPYSISVLLPIFVLMCALFIAGPILPSIYEQRWMNLFLGSMVYVSMFFVILIIIRVYILFQSLIYRFFAYRNGHRYDKDLSNAIIGHGSVGLALAITGVGVHFNLYALSFVINRIFNYQLQHLSAAFYIFGFLFMLILVLYGLIFNFLFIALGFRSCKFAN